MATFNPQGTDWTRPAQGGFVITPGAEALAQVIRGLYLATSGDVTVTFPDGTSVEFEGMAAGVVHPIAASHVTAATVTVIGVY